MITDILLSALSIYLLCGLLFAIPFVLVGVQRIDPHAANGSWSFRVLIIPGTTFLWPLLALRWFKGIHEPPEEHSPHRQPGQKLPGHRRALTHSHSSPQPVAPGAIEGEKGPL